MLFGYFKNYIRIQNYIVILLLIVYFLEAQENIVAVDITSNYPPETSNFPSIGYVRALSTEGVLSLNPTLIMGEEDMGPDLVIEQVTNTGIDLRIIEEDYTLDAITNKILCIARILDIEKQGINKINNAVQNKIKNQNKPCALHVIMVCSISPIDSNSTYTEYPNSDVPKENR